MTKVARRETALVAGGAGFIGSHLVDALLGTGFRVICLDNFQTGRDANLGHLTGHPDLDIVRADVIEPFGCQFAGRGITRVFNLACAASPPHYQADPEHTLLTCVLGTRNLLRLAEGEGARFLQASTSEIYGDPEIHPQTEDYWGHVNPTGPRACYDEGKRAAETLAFDYHRQGRADIRVARIFNTYGPRMRPDDGRVVSNVITQALAGSDITIYGSGEQTRSFCYVDDLVAGLMRLMSVDINPDGAINLGNPVEMEVRALMDLVLSMTGAASAVTFHKLPTDDPRRRRPDIGRARALLGWTPRVSLEQGLARTIDYFAGHASRACAEPVAAE